MSWIEAERSAATARLKKLPPPQPKEENYRFSGLQGFAFAEGPSVPGRAPTPAGLQWQAKSDNLLCLVSGQGQEFRSQSDSIIFCDWESLGPPQIDRVEKILQQKNRFHEDYFATLASAKAGWGFILIVPKGIRIELPGRFALWLNQNFAAYRNLVILEEGSQLRYVEEFSGDTAIQDPVVVGLTEFFLAPSAELQYSQAQALTQGTQYFLRQRFSLEDNAKLTITPFHTGGGRGQVRMDVELLGPGAVVDANGALKLHGRQHLDFWSETHHQHGQTQSQLQFFYVLDEESRAVFNGTIHIPQSSPGCEAYQKHRTLLLSEKAMVNTMPKLEIATDEVKCAHGASVSSVQEEQLYYLSSRGIAPREAEKMIINGFLQPVLTAFPESLRERTEERLGERVGILLN